jgi:dimethylargininase
MLIALIRDVSPSLQRCELTHLPRQPIDVARARMQHRQYEMRLAELGCAIYRLATEPEWPDAVFIEDTAIVLDELAIIARPGAEPRRSETAAVAEALRAFRNLFARATFTSSKLDFPWRQGYRLIPGSNHTR